MEKGLAEGCIDPSEQKNLHKKCRCFIIIDKKFVTFDENAE